VMTNAQKLASLPSGGNELFRATAAIEREARPG
jgi:hypothetical protein